MKLPLLARTLAILAVAAAILVPIRMIDGKIAERQSRAEGVVAQFAKETSGPQLLVGPLLALTCEETFQEERQVMRGGKAETLSETKTATCPTQFFSPRLLKASVQMPVETRHRGIYPIRLYKADVRLDGEFQWPAPPAAAGARTRAWKRAYVGLFVRDPRGIKSIGASAPTEFLAGIGETGIEQFSIRESLGAYGAHKAGDATPVSYRLSLMGTTSFAIAPVGEQNEIRIASNWPHPSFADAWSPDERTVGASGFEATWRVTSVATGGEATWRKVAAAGILAQSSGAGVALFDPVNVYALSFRATQYAFLFVLFTFCALALTEVVAGIRLHPVQYALVGSAIAVFFLLLIALSEQVSFPLAYGIAAGSCVALLTFYLRHPLGTLARAGAFLALFSTLYAVLYVVLKSEDHALLMGSLMTFLVLAMTMVATRKVDWSVLSASLNASRA